MGAKSYGSKTAKQVCPPGKGKPSAKPKGGRK